MLARSGEAVGFRPESLAADKSYGTAPFLAWLIERKVTPYIPVLDRKGQTDGKFTRDRFRYDPGRDRFLCPEEQELTLRGITVATGVKRYKARIGACRGCPLKPRCTDSASRTMIRLVDEDARETVRALADTEAFVTARARRRSVEMLFAHLKRHLEPAPPAAPRAVRRHRGVPPRSHRPEPEAPRQALPRVRAGCRPGGVALVSTSDVFQKDGQGPENYILGSAFFTDIGREVAQAGDGRGFGTSQDLPAASRRTPSSRSLGVTLRRRSGRSSS